MSTYFAPQLYIPAHTTDLSFYEKAFGATELRRFSNDDGSIHVAELSIDGAMFHIHEETADSTKYSPSRHGGTTVLIGLFVTDVDAVVTKAVTAGAIVLSPPESYDYGYRQSDIQDPFGHIWQIEAFI